jgi:poly-gamma-glutamate capsule biosynthesis protein CapA/YwtB (metallophosphatase superfamily)
LKRVPHVRAAMAVAVVLIFLAPLPGSCSTEQPEDQTRKPEDRAHKAPADVARKPPEDTDRSEPRASLVPIAHLTSLRESVSGEELSQTEGLAVPRGSREVAGELLDRTDFGSFESADAVVDHVSRTPGAVGLVPWDEVEPRVKALAVDGEALLGPGVVDPEGYPLRPGGATGPDPEELRRVVVAGDIVLDRGQNYMVIQQGMGLNFPLDGGYAAITGRYPEPSPYSEFGVIHQFTAVRRGGAGEVREYLRSADLTLANLENPVIRAAVYHPEATTFTGDLRLLPILGQAGIDGVTLGNNHILDAGTSGLQETLIHLQNAGISHAGAGMGLAAAREPMIFELGETRVGALSYHGVPSYDWSWATETAPGTAPLLAEVMEEDIERLRPEVDLIAVMPHWGMEYIATPEPGQVELAHAAIDAGADLVIGGHAHWPKGIEMYEGKPVFYGVGNFLLDQSWSEETSTGIFAEITLYGDRVLQVRPVPFVILDYAQPNFLVPEAGGDRALRNIFSASLGPEFEAYKASANDSR